MMAPKSNTKASSSKKASKSALPQRNSESTPRNGIKKGAKHAKRKPQTRSSARSRSSGHFSKASFLGHHSDRVEIPIDHASTFGAGSMANLTWGMVSDQAVSAIAKQRRHGGFRDLGVKRGKKSTFEKFMSMPLWQDDTELMGKEENNKTSLFLRIPLEVRRNIYKFLLVYKLPIHLDLNWSREGYNAALDFRILAVNKQVFRESSQCLCELNLFQASIKESCHSLPGSVVKFDFLRYLRNVVLECRRDSCTQRHLDLIVSFINNLIQAEAFLNSLTIIISPQRGGYAAFSAGLDDDAVTFLNFFEAPASKLMRRMTKLRCKTWNVVVKLSKTGRVVVPIELNGTTGNQIAGGWFANDKIAKRSGYMKTMAVKDGLLDLKSKLEQIFVDHENAMIAAMDEDDTISPSGTESATGQKQTEEATFKNLPIQLRRKWSEEDEKFCADIRRYRSIVPNLLLRLTETG